MVLNRSFHGQRIVLELSIIAFRTIGMLQMTDL